jgi:hypothetical protein
MVAYHVTVVAAVKVGLDNCRMMVPPGPAHQGTNFISDLSRQSVYHAWLGQLVAQAVLSGSEQQLPPELLAWSGMQPAAAAAASEAARPAMKDAE